MYASELFPTEIRATGYGWTTNLAGRVTEVLTPILIGLLIAPLGIPGAIAVVAAGPILGALLVLRYAPETRGLTLEQIATEASHFFTCRTDSGKSAAPSLRVEARGIAGPRTERRRHEREVDPVDRSGRRSWPARC